MWSQQACEALQKGVVLELRYDGYARHVEVYAVGTSTAGQALRRRTRPARPAVFGSLRPEETARARLRTALGVRLAQWAIRSRIPPTPGRRKLESTVRYLA